MPIKPTLHIKNRHRHGYDFKALSLVHPALSSFIKTNQYNNQPTIDFSDSKAVKALNCALLKKDYQLQHWDIPSNYLCPPIPGRVDYIHYLADLLKDTRKEITNQPALKLPKDAATKLKNNNISVLDIGTGASCIYPILGQREYNWHFVASDIDAISIKAAQQNIKANKDLAKNISCRLQSNTEHVFHGIINPDEFYHLTLCNPPFHKSLADASKGTMRKWQNLSNKKNNKTKTIQQKPLNFGGQKAELWCRGGEVAFIKRMIKESKSYQQQVLWFTCLLSKKDHLSTIKLALKKANVKQIKIIKMAQGNKVSRFIAWSFII